MLVGRAQPVRNLRIDGQRTAPYNGGFRSASGGAMYAVIRSGNKQYRVAPGDTLKVETLPGKVGGKITFEDVLAVGTDEKTLLTGSDAAKAKVVGKITAQGRHPKITVLKFKTCGQYKISRGHRQNYTAVEVSGIEI
jgi:large subunit ribosomal protein L21